MARPPSILLPRPWSRGEVRALSPGEASHARARRLRPGAEVVVTDGAGSRARGVVMECGARGASVRIEEEVAPPAAPWPLTLCVPPLRLPRLSWIVEKATELGVSRLIVAGTARSQGDRAAAAEAARDRLRRVAEAAAKQCGRADVPEISAGRDFAGVAATPADYRIALDPSGPPFPAEIRAGEAALWIGPEGGFRKDEIDRLRTGGWTIASLGGRILRSETAAVAAAVLAASAFDRALRAADNTAQPSTEGRVHGF